MIIFMENINLKKKMRTHGPRKLVPLPAWVSKVSAFLFARKGEAVLCDVAEG